MAGTSRATASALLGGLMLLGSPDAVLAQRAAPGLPALPVSPASLIAAAQVEPGGIEGTVWDEQGNPIAGVVVSVIGATTTFAVSDRSGHFEVLTLSPGPYLVRALSGGYIASKPQRVEIRSSTRSASSFALRRADGAPTILAAGIGASAAAPETPPALETPETQAGASETSSGDDHSETAWRLRHARRGILRNTSLPDTVLMGDGADEHGSVADLLGRAVSSPARVATSFFADTPFSGQVNFLTSNSFDTPEQLLSGASAARGIAYVKVSAPVGDHADWTMRGAITQADIASWIVAGEYKTRGPARYAHDFGMSYSTQRYSGGNPLALREMTDGNRNAGTVYGFETFTVTPSLAVTYGARYARYDYLEHRALFSPRAEVSLKPLDDTRLSVALSSRADAPGAEEFMPPGDAGIWLPPQRTFSSAAPGRPMRAERTTQLEAEVERDFGVTTLAVRAFRQHIDDQMVTVFGADVPDFPASKLGHYVVGTVGDADANGGGVALRSALGSRVRGSVAYSTAMARMTPAADLKYLILLSPSTIRRNAERIQDVTTTLEADVPETSTRVLVLYRIGNAYARPGELVDNQRFDSRFDIQVRQSLPFLDFTCARWEMLVAIRNFFRESESDQSIYDELLAVRAPKRIVGGVTLHF